MSCHAILTNSVGVLNGKLCRNDSMNGCTFCHEHINITPQEHKSRWIRKFLLGADGKPFLYHYDEAKKTRILGDLKNGLITLTQEDIQQIPNSSKYLDIYLLLFESGFIDLTNNNIALYTRSIRYLSEFWYRGERSDFLTLSPLAKRIVDVLILPDAEHLSFFLLVVPQIISYPTFQGVQLNNRMHSIAAFLMTLLQSNAAKQLSWEPIGQTLLPLFESKLGVENPVMKFLRDSYLPAFNLLNKNVKQTQKAWTNQYKEELMAVCWHPDRFMEYCLDEEEKAENRILFG